MKKIITIIALCIIEVFFCTSLFSAKTFVLNKTITKDTIIEMPKNIPTVYGIQVYGNVNLISDSSLVRIIFVENENQPVLLNEFYYPLFINGVHEIYLSEENDYFANGVKYGSFEIYIKDAELNVDSVVFYESKRERLIFDNLSYDEKINNKILQLNINLEAEGFIWRSDTTLLKEKFYLRNYDYYGANSYAFELYKKGIYSPTIPEPIKGNTSSTLVDNWDWRNRHGANNPASLYYDGDKDSVEVYIDDSLRYVTEVGNGWLTKINPQMGNSGEFSEQCHKGCFLFSPTNAVECNYNLYYNDHYDLSLSEQYIMDCSPNNTHNCYKAGSVYGVIDTYKKFGVINDSCYPYINDTSDCNYTCTPTNRVYINNSSYFAFNSTTDDILKNKIILNGSLPAIIGGHTMCLCGFGKINSAMSLDPKDSYATLNIPENSPYMGHTYWIFKNSRTIFDGHGGYVYALRSYEHDTIYNLTWHGFYVLGRPIDSLNVDLVPRCRDEDGDGYFYWGIGPKPSSCPDTAPDEPDCDDSNPLLGTFDEYYNCKMICNPDFYSTYPIEITNDTIWSSDLYIFQDIIIKNGGMLRITGNLFFMPQSKIIVENGGLLMIDGGTLTTNCDGELWQGISVVGDCNNFGQIPNTLPGQVIIKNNSVIEFAIKGVAGYNNAIVYITNSQFRNCKISVNLEHYNRSFVPPIIPTGRVYIHNTKFITNDKFKDIPQNHIFLYNVDYVGLRGNNFINSVPIDVLNASQRGNGIFAYNSGFACTENRLFYYPYIIPGAEMSVFDGLAYGIRAEGSSAKTVYVENCKFNNYYEFGVYMKSGYANTIINSVFNKNASTPYSAGLYMENCTGFKLENNTFNGGSHGLVVKNSGYSNNTIYRNNFDNLTLSLHAQGVNSNFDGSQGLFIQCNDYNQNSTHNWVCEGNIKRLQGYLDADNQSNSISAANIFNADYLEQPRAFYIEDNNINNLDYQYFYNCLNDATDITDYVSDNVETIETGLVFTDSASCPSKLPCIIARVDFTQVFAISANLVSLKNTLDSLVDGGDTELVLQKIQSLNSRNFTTICSELIDLSPYLSDEALCLFMQTPVPNHDLSKALVLLANSPLPKNARNELDNMVLLAQYKQQVINAQVGTNAVDIKLNEISQIAFEKDMALNSYLRYGLNNDSLPEFKDTVINYLINDHDYHSKCLVIPLLISAKKHGEVSLQISELRSLALNEEQELQEELEDFASLQEILLAAETDFTKENIISLVARNFTFIENLAYSPDRLGSGQAQTLLQIAEYDEFSPELILPVFNKNFKFPLKNELPKKIYKTDDLIEVFPNPASNEIWVEYILSQNSKIDRIAIFDLKGNLVISKSIRSGLGIERVDVSSLNEACYILKIGKYSKKINIVK